MNQLISIISTYILLTLNVFIQKKKKTNELCAYNMNIRIFTLTLLHFKFTCSRPALSYNRPCKNHGRVFRTMDFHGPQIRMVLTLPV